MALGKKTRIGVLEISVETAVDNAIADMKKVQSEAKKTGQVAEKDMGGSFSRTTESMQKDIGKVTSALGALTGAIGVAYTAFNLGQNIGKQVFGDINKEIKETKEYFSLFSQAQTAQSVNEIVASTANLASKLEEVNTVLEDTKGLRRQVFGDESEKTVQTFLDKEIESLKKQRDLIVGFIDSNSRKAVKLKENLDIQNNEKTVLDRQMEVATSLLSLEQQRNALLVQTAATDEERINLQEQFALKSLTSQVEAIEKRRKLTEEERDLYKELVLLTRQFYDNQISGIRKKAAEEARSARDAAQREKQRADDKRSSDLKKAVEDGFKSQESKIEQFRFDVLRQLQDVVGANVKVGGAIKKQTRNLPK